MISGYDHDYDYVCMFVCMSIFFDFMAELLIYPPRRPGAAGGTVKPWPGAAGAY